MRKIVPLLIISLIITVFPQTGFATTTAPFQTPAKQAIMMDYDTGMVLFEKNADERMPTSSMSKVISMYLVFEALEDGRLTLNAELPVSEKAWSKGGSKMFVEVGDTVKVEDLIRGVVVQSGNDATIVLAEGLAGSEDAFADALNMKAQELGMESSHFMNASGWPDPEHYSTARDLAKLAKQIIHDFPQYYHYYSEQEYTYNNIKQDNRNPLLYRNIGVDGIKTGHTEDGGYGLMASGKYNDRRVIMVVNGLESTKERANEGARIIEWGMKGFQNVKIFDKGDVVENIKVVMGKTGTVPVTVTEDIFITLPVTVKNDLKVEAVLKEPLLAPVRAGTEVGYLHVEIPRVTTLKIPLETIEGVDSLGFVASTVEKAKRLISGNKP